MQPGQYLIVDALDGAALAQLPHTVQRARPMAQSLVAFDQMGADCGQLIAVSEGREAAMPFAPRRVAIDAYCAAILDEVQVD